MNAILRLQTDLNFLDLVRQALPRDVPMDELMRLGKPEWWQGKPRLAIAYALRKSPRINWEAYLQKYTDVKIAGADPCYHFLTNGVFENRKLLSWNIARSPSNSGIKISVIIINNAEALFLEKSIEILLQQTLKEIEIIVVDAGVIVLDSGMVSSLANKDERIKVLTAPIKGCLHSARKAGIHIATGAYVIIMDSMCNLLPDACEKAYNLISRGYDICEFCVEFVNIGGRLSSESGRISQTRNSRAEGEYRQVDILRGLADGSLSSNLINKIFDRSAAQEAFACMVDRCGAGIADMYEFFVLASHCRNIIKSNAILGSRIIVVGEGQIPSYLSESEKSHTVSELSLLKNSITRIGNDCKTRIYADSIEARVLKEITANILIAPKKVALRLYHELASSFGVLLLVKSIASIFSDRRDDYAQRFREIDFPKMQERGITNLGVYCALTDEGSALEFARWFTGILSPLGYQLTFFTEQKEWLDLPREVVVKAIPAPEIDLKNMDEHLSTLYEEVNDSNIQAMLFMDVHRVALLWQAVLLKFMGISAIGRLRFEHNSDLLQRGVGRYHNSVICSVRCLDMVLCPTLASEIYMCGRGVNARHYPLPAWSGLEPKSTDRQKDAALIFLGNIGDPYGQTGLCLKILTALVKQLPGIRAIFMDDYKDKGRRDIFFQKARALGLSFNIELVSQESGYASYLERSRLAFSSSYSGTDLGMIQEAQMRGIPVLGFESGFGAAMGNEGLLVVPQDHPEFTAERISYLLADSEAYGSCARMSLEAAQRRVEEEKKGFLAILNSLGKDSEPHSYSQADYQDAIRLMTSNVGRLSSSYNFNASLAKA